MPKPAPSASSPKSLSGLVWMAAGIPIALLSLKAACSALNIEFWIVFPIVLAICGGAFQLARTGARSPLVGSSSEATAAALIAEADAEEAAKKASAKAKKQARERRAAEKLREAERQQRNKAAKKPKAPKQQQQQQRKRAGSDSDEDLLAYGRMMRDTSGTTRRR